MTILAIRADARPVRRAATPAAVGDQDRRRGVRDRRRFEQDPATGPAAARRGRIEDRGEAALAAVAVRRDRSGDGDSFESGDLHATSSTSSEWSHRERPEAAAATATATGQRLEGCGKTRRTWMSAEEAARGGSRSSDRRAAASSAPAIAGAVRIHRTVPAAAGVFGRAGTETATAARSGAPTIGLAAARRRVDLTADGDRVANQQRGRVRSLEAEGPGGLDRERRDHEHADLMQLERLLREPDVADHALTGGARDRAGDLPRVGVEDGGSAQVDGRRDGRREHDVDPVARDDLGAARAARRADAPEGAIDGRSGAGRHRCRGR